MNIKKELGAKIKQLRKNKNLTQEKLSEMINISQRNLAAIESGANFVKADTLEKLIVALDTTTEELFSNDYLRNTAELLKKIQNDIDEIKQNKQKLQILYKFTGFIKNL